VTNSAVLLESKKLLGPETFVVHLAGRLNEILQVCSGQEVAEVDELAVVLILDIDDTPTVLTSAYSMAVDGDGLFTANDSEWNDGLNLGVDGSLLRVVLVVLEWVHADVVERKLLLDSVLEGLAFFQSETISFGDDWNYVDNLAELLQHYDIDRLKCVTSWVNKIQAAVDPGILNVSLSLRSEFLAEVSRVLVLDVLDNWVPAAVVVDEITEAWCIDNVQAETDTVLFNDM